jgi:hypothetical protein
VRLPDEDEVRADIIYKACNYGRVGYRMVCHMMRNEGRKINHKRVERIWREEGLKLPQNQEKKCDFFATAESMFKSIFFWVLSRKMRKLRNEAIGLSVN